MVFTSSPAVQIASTDHFGSACRSDLALYLLSDADHAQEGNANSVHFEIPVPVLATQPHGPCMAVAHDTQLWLLNSRWLPLHQLLCKLRQFGVRCIAQLIVASSSSCATCRTASLIQLDDSATSAPIRAIAFDPSGSLLLSGGDDKTLRVWQIESRRLLHQWYVRFANGIVLHNLHLESVLLL